MICDSPPGSHAGHCRKGAYGSEESFGALAEDLCAWEAAQSCESETANRLFYFAIPPNVFLENAVAIKVNLNQEREIASGRVFWRRRRWPCPQLDGIELLSRNLSVTTWNLPPNWSRMCAALLSCRCCYICCPALMPLLLYPHSKAAAAVEIASARGHTAF